jgi:hypothetical protein
MNGGPSLGVAFVVCSLLTGCGASGGMHGPPFMLNAGTDEGRCKGEFRCDCDAYYVAQLPIPNGFTSTTPLAMNDRGWILADAFGLGSRVPFLLSPDGAITMLPPPEGARSRLALGLSPNTEVLGGIQGKQATVPFVWSNGTDHVLGTPAKDLGGTARARNTRGITVGSGYQMFFHEAVTWSDATPTTLPGLPGAYETIAYGINESGVIVGKSNANVPGDVSTHAVYWVKGIIYDLGEDSSAIAVNDSGEILVIGEEPGSDRVHSLTGSDRVLTAFPGADDVAPVAINDHGVVVGGVGIDASQPVVEYVAVIWPESSPIDLNSLAHAPEPLRLAIAITNDGSILAVGDTAGFILRPNLDCPGVPASSQ